ncbi:MAG: hypothetical protein WCG83_06295 [Candidatus Peregrinibacteria bacterium]
MPPTPTPPSPSHNPLEQKLDNILTVIEKMNRRDKWRTIGGFFRSIIAIVPVLVFLWATWYTLQNGDQLLQKITSMAAEQAGRVAQQNTNSLLNLIQKKPAATQGSNAPTP